MRILRLRNVLRWSNCLLRFRNSRRRLSVARMDLPGRGAHIPKVPVYTPAMARKVNRLQVRCTCCEAVLTVDGASGEVLFTEKPKKKSLSFEDALSSVQREKDTADDRFKEAFEREQ